jgi:hypothetical protein
LRWREPNEGREITWREDAHDGQIVVRAGGWRRKIVPLLKIDPLSERAMQYSRRPVTGAGLWSFNARLRQFVEEEAPRGSWRAELLDHVSIAGRPCYCFQFSADVDPAPEVQGRDVASDHPRRQVVIYIDAELGLPIACERFGPPTPGAPQEAALEESYAFTELQLNPPVSDHEFDLAVEPGRPSRDNRDPSPRPRPTVNPGVCQQAQKRKQEKHRAIGEQRRPGMTGPTGHGSELKTDRSWKPRPDSRPN